MMSTHGQPAKGAVPKWRGAQWVCVGVEGSRGAPEAHGRGVRGRVRGNLPARKIAIEGEKWRPDVGVKIGVDGPKKR